MSEKIVSQQPSEWIQAMLRDEVCASADIGKNGKWFGVFDYIQPEKRSERSLMETVDIYDTEEDAIKVVKETIQITQDAFRKANNQENS